MNDEIKEIIEYFKDDIDYLEEELKYPNFKGRYITIRDKECEYLRKLLDYITNLQQINKNLTNSLNKKVEEGIKLQLKKDILQEQFKDYKSRNDKAIEFIKENKDKYYQDWGEDDGSYDTYLGEYEIDKLIDILQGDSND